MAVSSTELQDREKLRDTVMLYAAGADQRDKALWSKILADDCSMEGPGFQKDGIAECLESIDQLKQMFVKTRHNILNHNVDIKGDTAQGETYCIADHIIDVDGRQHILSWHIRYQDKWIRSGSDWKFTHRKLILDWEETRQLSAADHDR